MTIAVITIVAGRHLHLRNQQFGLAWSDRLPDIYVVVSMGDAEAVRQTGIGPLSETSCRNRTRLLEVGDRLPLAEARNAGAAEAIAAGADHLVFLDVDCIPSASMLDSYGRALDLTEGPALHCGVVRYLDAPMPATQLDPSMLHSRPHPARPVPGPEQLIASTDWQLFWSLSFALSRQTWLRLNGFHEEYVGYGAEDTDFGYAAHQQGVNLVWVGGADAYHQYHPTSSRSSSHLDDILRNATIFERRWGFWPMLGWLEEFEATGTAHYDATTNRWLRF
ncbi:GT2 family glycosyltransferase [Nakamurella sp. UYEF19]|uniref:glycosyltransferase family 2 protein n=1 Tax=Nakamurella sp. UYEF19 TaxID=1756392 RepID=UPI003398FABA